MNNKINPFFLICSMVVIGGVLYAYNEAVSVPKNFPVGKNFVINENESVKSISNRLEEEGYIQSAVLFRAGISFLKKDKEIHLGGYSFSEPSSLFGIINRLIKGSPDAPLLSITIPEGSTLSEIAEEVHEKMPEITSSSFIELVTNNKANGTLFPSTYYLLPSYGAQDIIALMQKTFTEKTKALFTKYPLPNQLTTERDVIILASILEGEAKSKEDMQMVSGILLARLAKKMPLQVDVSPITYKQRGLPEEPINNPGLIALEAVYVPKASEYLYYITGNDGKMYYAKTFDEHKKNIQKYLR